jgi:hypothetical protein
LPSGDAQDGDWPHRKQSPGRVGCQPRCSTPAACRSSELRGEEGGDGRTTELRRRRGQPPATVEQERCRPTDHRFISPGSKPIQRRPAPELGGANLGWRMAQTFLKMYRRRNCSRARKRKKRVVAPSGFSSRNECLTTPDGRIDDRGPLKKQLRDTKSLEVSEVMASRSVFKTCPQPSRALSSPRRSGPKPEVKPKGAASRKGGNRARGRPDG